MTSKMSLTPQVPLTTFLDEASYFLGNADDGLKEKLCKIEDIPNVTYLVKDGQVFVFDKLIHDVKERLEDMSTTPLADLVHRLLPLANVSPKDAVEAWGIVPEPYEMVPNASGELMIRHRPFNARLPDTFQTKYEVQEVFVHLLVGAIQPGSGDFSYRGQPMILCEPLDPTLLPPRPVIQSGLEPVCYVYTTLDQVAYESGFEPISKTLFSQVQKLEVDWKDDSARSIQYADARVAEIWVQTADLQLELLNDQFHKVPDYGLQDFAELRLLYPELWMLSDDSFYTWFDLFQMECRNLNGWNPNRDDDFLFYLLGKVAASQFEGETAKEVGQWVAYALLYGNPLDDALAFGRAANLYNNALGWLAHRIADAMRFLRVDKNTTVRQGAAITTMMDLFQAGRSYNKVAITITQDRLSDNKPKDL